MKKICVVLLLFIFAFCGCTIAKGKSDRGQCSVSSRAGSAEKVSASSGASSGSVSSETKLYSTAEGVPVLLYHAIMTPAQKGVSKNGLIVTTDEFDRQMSILKQAGFTAVNLDGLYACLTGKSPCARKIVITFDDGYKANCYLAAPILKKYGFRATVFVITKELDKPDVPYTSGFQYLSMEDIKKFGDTLDFASHTNNLHENLINVSDSDKMIKDLCLSRQKLNETLYFSYPLGKHNARVEEMVKQAGFRMALTTQFKMACPGMDLLRVPRMEIVSPLSDHAFKSYLEIKYK